MLVQGTLCSTVPALSFQVVRKIDLPNGRASVFFAGIRLQVKGAAEQQFRLRELGPVIQDEGQIVVALQSQEMLLTQYAAADFERLTVERFGLGVLALIGQADAEVVVRDGRLRMLIAKEPSLDCQRLLILSLGIRILSLLVQRTSQVAVSSGYFMLVLVACSDCKISSDLRYLVAASSY